MSDDLREKLEKKVHEIWMDVEYHNYDEAIALLETYADQRVCEALDRIEKASAHTQPSLHDVIESIRKELTNLTTKV